MTAAPAPAIDPMTMPDLTDSTPLLSDPAALRARADKDGVLFFRGLFARADVLDLRARFIQIIADAGWLKPGTNPDDAVANITNTWEGTPAYQPIFEKFQSMPEFHALAHSKPILQMFEKLFGEQVLVHPRNIGRIVLPDTPATPPHQDFFYIRGAEQTWTAWLPLGDAPRSVGGLAMRVGSHKSGFLPVKPMLGAGGSGIEEHNQTGQWHTADYRAGDVVVFHSFNIHRGLPNSTGTRIRLSCDYRYQPLSHPVDIRSLKPHFARFDWSHYQANWPAKFDWLRDYWTKLPLKTVDYVANK